MNHYLWDSIPELTFLHTVPPTLLPVHRKTDKAIKT